MKRTAISVEVRAAIFFACRLCWSLAMCIDEALRLVVVVFAAGQYPVADDCRTGDEQGHDIAHYRGLKRKSQKQAKDEDAQ